jgi:DNA-binding CsgD family transcriptional regulator
MRESADVVGVIEAAYAREPNDASWIRRLTEVAGPALDQGLGVFAGLYDTNDGHQMRVEPVHAVGACAKIDVTGLFREAYAPMEPALMRFLFNNGPVGSGGRQRAGMSLETFNAHPATVISATKTGGMFTDCLGVISGNPAGPGCLIMAPFRVSVRARARTCELWTRIAAHLAAAVRLRRGVAAHEAPRVEAVLSPSGRVEHAEGVAREADARSALSFGASRMDRARGSLRRRDPHEAVALWSALVEGRWSLVEHFDHDGRRYVLARRNETSAAKLRGLTFLERQVLTLAAMGHTNKLIAYQLGISLSAVAMRLSRAAKKLGVRTRVQLMEKCREGNAGRA